MFNMLRRVGRQPLVSERSREESSAGICGCPLTKHLVKDTASRRQCRPRRLATFDTQRARNGLRCSKAAIPDPLLSSALQPNVPRLCPSRPFFFYQRASTSPSIRTVVSIAKGDLRANIATVARTMPPVSSSPWCNDIMSSGITECGPILCSTSLPSRPHTLRCTTVNCSSLTTFHARPSLFSIVAATSF